MKTKFALILCATAFVGAPLTAAASADHSKHTQSAKPAETDKKPDMVDGEVRKIDLDAKKITLKHGPIKSLDMPGMTMVFQIKDNKILDNIKVGDKVKFSTEQTKSGYVVTSIEGAKFEGAK